MMKRTCIASLAMVLMGTAVAAADEKVDFAKEIQPIFVEHCASCHGAEKALGKMRLHTVEVLREKLAAKPEVLVAGDPEKSGLYQRLVLPADHAKRMPKKADPLPKEKIELIAKWIKEGATLPAAVAADKPAATTADTAPAVTPADKPELIHLSSLRRTHGDRSQGTTRLFPSSLWEVETACKRSCQ